MTLSQYHVWDYLLRLDRTDRPVWYTWREMVSRTEVVWQNR